MDTPYSPYPHPFPAPGSGKTHGYSTSFAEQIVQQTLVQQELRIDDEDGIDFRENANLLLKERGGRTTKARKTAKWRCVDMPLLLSVLTELAGLLRGDWGDDLPAF